MAQARSETAMPVGVPLFSIGYKAKPYAGKELVKKELEAGILLQMLFGTVSPLYRELFDEGLVNSQFSSEVFSGDGFFSCIIGGESKQPDEVFARIQREVARAAQQGLDKALFDTIKKQRYGSMVRSMNNVEYCSELMLNAHLYGVNAFDSAQALADLTFESLSRSLPELLDNTKTAISIVAANQ